MKAILYNRILLFLGFVGLFIAGVLSLAHAWNVVPPCGASSDCNTVTSDPSSMWFGVYVGYIGLAGYVILTGLALMRIFASPTLFRPLTLVGYLVAVGGTVISIGLQFYSFFQIHAMCKWCLSSAVTMTITLVLYALLYQELTDRPAEAEPHGRGDKDFILSGVFALILIFSLSGMGYELKHSDPIRGEKITIPPNYSLIPNRPNLYGDFNAPITIVEFADLNCPSCKANSPMVKEFVREHEGKIRLIYRHLPLPMHKTSALAAAIDEYAAEKGKFWDYTLAVMGQKEEITDPTQLYQIASSVNIDVKDLQHRLSNENDPLYQRLTDDENAAALIGIVSTPTFIVLAPGVKPNAFGPSSIRDALLSPPYSTIMNGK